ncbi:unnamed protein product, partial [Symbiodinium pilosum]
ADPAEKPNNKDGRPKKVKPDVDSSAGNRKRSKGAANAAENEPDKPKAKQTKAMTEAKTSEAPSTRVSQKRKADASTGADLQIKRQGAKHDEKDFPRYRPCKDSWMQRLWDGSVLAFKDIITPQMAPGQKTKLEAI